MKGKRNVNDGNIILCARGHTAGETVQLCDWNCEWFKDGSVNPRCDRVTCSGHAKQDLFRNTTMNEWFMIFLHVKTRKWVGHHQLDRKIRPGIFETSCDMNKTSNAGIERRAVVLRGRNENSSERRKSEGKALHIDVINYALWFNLRNHIPCAKKQCWFMITISRVLQPQPKRINVTIFPFLYIGIVSPITYVASAWSKKEFYLPSLFYKSHIASKVLHTHRWCNKKSKQLNQFPIINHR